MNAEKVFCIFVEPRHTTRYEALQIEAVTSGRKNAAVEMKWADLLNLEIPQELSVTVQHKFDCTESIAEF